MKKIVLLTALVAFCFGCEAPKGNGEEQVNVLGDRDEILEVVIKNETNQVITVSDAYVFSMTTSPINIATGENEVVREVWFPTNLPLPSVPLSDMFENENTLIYNVPDYGLFVEEPLTMTIDGEAVSSEIWKRKHWAFTSTTYKWTYTLTVTDELLASLTAAE